MSADRPMKVHELKTWPDPFGAILQGRKHHEVRKNDRDFAVGDLLYLREWQPKTDHPDGGYYTGFGAFREVTYISAGGTWGLPDDLCVMSIQVNIDAETRVRRRLSGQEETL